MNVGVASYWENKTLGEKSPRVFSPKFKVNSISPSETLGVSRVSHYIFNLVESVSQK